MRQFKLCSIGVSVLIFMLWGCASNQKSGSLKPERHPGFNQVQVFKGGVKNPYRILDSVKGLSCQRNAYQKQKITEDEAIEEVRLNAARLGADAVIDIACRVNSGKDRVDNCVSSIVCVGDAIRYEK